MPLRIRRASRGTESSTGLPTTQLLEHRFPVDPEGIDRGLDAHSEPAHRLPRNKAM
jgi:hypothetical protein